MDGQDGNLELNDGQKTRLLSLGIESDRPAEMPDGDEQRGDLLCDILRHPLPADGQAEPAATAVQSYLIFQSVAGPPLRELLLAPETDIAALRRIKEYAKTMGKKAGTDVEKDAFLAVYLAAIAAAKLFHSDRITEHSDMDLTRFLEFFARQPWMPTILVGLFTEAAQCRQGGT